MSVWLIDPHEPLIFRDGKPFGAIPGVRAQSLPFPFPSTVAGGVRSLIGLNEHGQFAIPYDELNRLKQFAIKGPILVELTQDGRDIEQDRWLIPAPADAQILKDSKQQQSRISQLVPRPFPTQFQTDVKLPDGMMLVGRKETRQQEEEYQSEKPDPHAPRYWYWQHFVAWLKNPETYTDQLIHTADLGHNGPVPQARVHVAIDPKTRAGKDQYLFDTVGMEFATLVRDKNADATTAYEEQEAEPRLHLHNARRLALAIIIDDKASTPDAPSPYALEERLHHFGGERRLVSWRKSQLNAPTCPEDLIKAISEQGQCRLILLTPAFFAKGFYPETRLPPRHNVQPVLRAIRIERPEIVSGWDLAAANRSQPAQKPTRRLAPAGTVLFLQLEGSKSDIRKWVETSWLQCCTDGQQEANDGFGLAVPGIWSPTIEEKENA